MLAAATHRPSRHARLVSGPPARPWFSCFRVDKYFPYPTLAPSPTLAPGLRTGLETTQVGRRDDKIGRGKNKHNRRRLSLAWNPNRCSPTDRAAADRLRSVPGRAREGMADRDTGTNPIRQRRRSPAPTINEHVSSCCSRAGSTVTEPAAPPEPAPAFSPRAAGSECAPIEKLPAAKASRKPRESRGFHPEGPVRRAGPGHSSTRPWRRVHRLCCGGRSRRHRGWRQTFGRASCRPGCRVILQLWRETSRGDTVFNTVGCTRRGYTATDPSPETLLCLGLVPLGSRGEK